MRHDPVRLTSFAVAALVAAAPVAAADTASDFAAAQSDFERGLRNESGTGERAAERLAELVAREPAKPLLLAYHGAIQAVRAKEAWAPWTKMKRAESGLASLDKALALLEPAHDQARVRGVPVSEETRLLAATTFLAVPAIFHRLESARAALADALASPAFASSPPAIQARLLQQAAIVARRDGKPEEEAQALRRVLAAWPDGFTAAPARARLAELGR